MNQALWQRHYQAGITGSFHGDMAMTFVRMLQDPECDQKTAREIAISVRHHRAVEGAVGFCVGRKWFTEMFDQNCRPEKTDRDLT